MSLLENVLIDCVLISDDVNSTINKSGLIFEAKVKFEPIPGVKHHTYRIDPQLGEGGPGRQKHIHVYNKGKELFAMNVDSTSHDSYHQVKIPDKIATFLSQKGFKLPPNNIIEFLQIPAGSEMLLEEFSSSAINSTAFDIGYIVRHANVITIIEASLTTSEVRMHPNVICKYRHVNHLDDIPQDRIGEVKQIIIQFLKETGKYCDEGITIIDDSSAIHRLFVAWSE